MNTALWIIQGLLAVAFLAAGAMKLATSRAGLAEKGMGYVDDLTDLQVKGIGVLEVLAAIGLILPPVLDVVPVLAAVAASGLVLTMIGAAVVHGGRGERQSLPVNIVLGGLALFVAIERFGPNSF